MSKRERWIYKDERIPHERPVVGKRENLTPRERELLVVIRKHTEPKIPSVRKLAVLMNVHSPATIHEMLVSLRRKGWLN